MRRTTALAVLAVLAGVCHAPRARGEEPAARPRVAFFERVADARRAAQASRRPLFIALHRRPVAASPQAAARFAAWSELYRDPRVVEASRAFACALRVAAAPEGGDPDAGETPAVTHLVLDGQDRVLLRVDGWPHAPGEASARALLALLRGGLRAFGPIPADAPVLDERAATRRPPVLEGASPLRPVAMPLGVPGVVLRLRWELPAPALDGDTGAGLRAHVSMRWDGQGPWRLGPLESAPGETIDVPVAVRFEALPGLEPWLTRGTHRLDVYLEPQAGAYPFSRGPLHVGRVWIDLGEGGGGGGGADPPPSDPPEPPPEQPAPPGEAPPADPPDATDRTEVVEPFVREGATVRKDDAVVAVEDPDGAVKPPRRVPLEEALRAFEKLEERAIGEERFAPRDRDFLLLYFDALRRAAGGRPR